MKYSYSLLVSFCPIENIQVRFYELDEDGQEVWSDYGLFGEHDVHHQYAIVFRFVLNCFTFQKFPEVLCQKMDLCLSKWSLLFDDISHMSFNKADYVSLSLLFFFKEHLAIEKLTFKSMFQLRWS